MRGLPLSRRTPLKRRFLQEPKNSLKAHGRSKINMTSNLPYSYGMVRPLIERSMEIWNFDLARCGRVAVFHEEISNWLNFDKWYLKMTALMSWSRIWNNFSGRPRTFWKILEKHEKIGFFAIFIDFSPQMTYFLFVYSILHPKIHIICDFQENFRI